VKVGLFTAIRDLDPVELADGERLTVNAGDFRVNIGAGKGPLDGTATMHVIENVEGKIVFEWPRT
jgi:hypothetical protein